MLMLADCVRVGRVLSASLAAISRYSFAAARWLVGLRFPSVGFHSSCIHVWRVVSISCSLRRMSSWACSPFERFHRVVLLIPSSVAICSSLHPGYVVMKSTACIISAVFFVSDAVILVSINK